MMRTIRHYRNGKFVNKVWAVSPFYGLISLKKKIYQAIGLTELTWNYFNAFGFDFGSEKMLLVQRLALVRITKVG